MLRASSSSSVASARFGLSRRDIRTRRGASLARASLGVGNRRSKGRSEGGEFGSEGFEFGAEGGVIIEVKVLENLCDYWFVFAVPMNALADEASALALGVEFGVES